MNHAGYLDCASFPLHFKPRTDDCRNYHRRKLGCSISTIIGSDENSFIRHTHAGWPRCAHDNCILAHSKLQKKSTKYFACLEHLLMDSAFAAEDNFAPVHKKPCRHELEEEETLFND